MSGPTPLKVMLVDDNPHRAAVVEASLRGSGVDALVLVPQQANLLVQIEQHLPDVIVIDLDSPGRDLLESLSIVSTHNPTPIVMFSGEEDPDYIADAVDAGVTAYLVDGINADKVRPIIDVAMAQFRQFQQLRRELADTRTELGERKLVDQAKALLMKHYAMSEQDAYACIRSEAMNHGLRTTEVARRILTSLGAAGSRPARGRTSPEQPAGRTHPNSPDGTAGGEQP